MNIFQTLTVHAVHDGLKTLYSPRGYEYSIPTNTYDPGFKLVVVHSFNPGGTGGRVRGWGCAWSSARRTPVPGRGSCVPLRSEVGSEVNFITYGIVFMGCFSVLRRPRRELPARLLSVRHSPERLGSAADGPRSQAVAP